MSKPISENIIEESAIELLQSHGKCLNYDLFDYYDDHDSNIAKSIQSHKS